MTFMTGKSKPLAACSKGPESVNGDIHPLESHHLHNLIACRLLRK